MQSADFGFRPGMINSFKIRFSANQIPNYHFLLLLHVRRDQIMQEEERVRINCYENVIFKLCDETAFHHGLLVDRDVWCVESLHMLRFEMQA